MEVNGMEPGGLIAYPFLMQDGQTLYFAYTGPGTLGGYDLYVTRYDRTSGRTPRATAATHAVQLDSK